MHWNVIDYNKFLNIVFMHLNKQNYYSNSGKLLLVPYTKDFRRITRF